MKKVFVVILGLMLMISVFVSCSKVPTESTAKDNAANQNEASENKDISKKEEKKVIKMFQFKVEIAEQLDEMKKDFEKVFPNSELVIETAGGGVDYGAMLKTKFASNEVPDIFNNGGNSELDLWIEKLEDLSDQPWVGNLVEGTGEQISKDGKIYGMPMNIEGYGFLYNKDLFAKAGIEKLPSTIGELETVCEKLKENGITVFSNGYQEWWILGIHNFNGVIAEQEDPKKFIKGLREGTVNLQDNEIANNWVALLDLTLKYGQENSLTVDYNTQVTQFAAGQRAIMQQGNWTQVQINEINPDINIGILPMPMRNIGTEEIFVGVPNNWVIAKQSSVKQQAKELLNWMVSSDIGKRYIVEEFKFIPSFVNIPYEAEALGNIAASIGEYSKEGKVLGWYWTKLPDGSTNEIGANMQAYISGKLNKSQLFDNIEEVIKSMSK